MTKSAMVVYQNLQKMYNFCVLSELIYLDINDIFFMDNLGYAGGTIEKFSKRSPHYLT